LSQVFGKTPLHATPENMYLLALSVNLANNFGQTWLKLGRLKTMVINEWTENQYFDKYSLAAK